MDLHEYFLKFLDITLWPFVIGLTLAPIVKGIGEIFSAIAKYILFLIQEKM